MPEMGEIGPEPEEGEPVEQPPFTLPTESQDKPDALREVAATFREAADALEKCAARWDSDYPRAATEASNIFAAIASSSGSNANTLAYDVLEYQAEMVRRSIAAKLN